MFLIFLISTTTSTIRNILLPLTKSMPQFTAKLHTKNNLNNRTSNHHKTQTDLREQVVFRWFKFTLKPPYSIAHDKLRLAIWDTSFWAFWLKFGHKGP